jgi:hypothetical protein
METAAPSSPTCMGYFPMASVYIMSNPTVITCMKMKSANTPLGNRGENSLTLSVPNVLDGVEMKCFCPFLKY